MIAKPLKECGVLILGGTSGVGLETAGQFLEAGSRVVVLGRNAERGAAACQVCRDRVAGADVEFLAVDARDPASVLGAEGLARERLGAIDVLMNTTGPSQALRLVHHTPISEMRPLIDELVMPPLHMTHAVLPDMRRRGGGSIINVASDAARIPTPGETLIGAAMAAIVMYSRTVALEVKREGVRVNVLTPSLIANTGGAELIAADPFSAKVLERAAAMADLGVVEPEDLAAMTVYLAGPAARRITGQVISINGGISVA